MLQQRGENDTLMSSARAVFLQVTPSEWNTHTPLLPPHFNGSAALGGSEIGPFQNLS